jgi:hypothetical protein
MVSTVKVKFFWGTDFTALETAVNNWLTSAAITPTQIVGFQVHSVNTFGQGGSTVAPYSFTIAIMHT